MQNRFLKIHMKMINFMCICRSFWRRSWKRARGAAVLTKEEHVQSQSYNLWLLPLALAPPKEHMKEKYMCMKTKGYVIRISFHTHEGEGLTTRGIGRRREACQGTNKIL